MENPYLTLRKQAGLTQEDLGLLVNLSKQYISKVEKGMYPNENRALTQTLLRRAGIEDMHPKEIYQLYQEWIKWKRHSTRTTRDFIQLKTTPCSWGAEGDHTKEPWCQPTNIPNYRLFFGWRKHYFQSTYEFCEAFCCKPYDVERYEQGRMGRMPKGIIEALGDLLEGFDYAHR